MAKADMHIHSIYSDHPSEWFLQKVGTRESYVQPKYIYETAVREGMDFVTITDHNCICGALEIKKLYPDRVIVGTELTAYFPEDRCKIHILVWGLDRDIFEKLNSIRVDIYKLRDYLKAMDLTHAVAHATFSVNRKLTVEHIEKLILLFDYFEGINGSRTDESNTAIQKILNSLTMEKMAQLYNTHKIEPYSTTPWIKGICGGSDDHSGLFTATTWTEVDRAETPEAFLKGVRDKRCRASGRNNDFRGFALSLYKIAYDFSQHQTKDSSHKLFQLFHSQLFQKESRLTLSQKFQLKKIIKKQSLFGKNRTALPLLERALFNISSSKDSSMENRSHQIYESISTLIDYILVSLINDIVKNLKKGEVFEAVRNCSTAIPPLFLSAPFLSTTHILHSSRELQTQLYSKFNIEQPNKLTLWITDTIEDLNGVSETVRKVASIGVEKDLPLHILASGKEQKFISPNIEVVPSICSYTPNFFSTFTLYIPSFLKTLLKIQELKPTQIVISTPGPLGLIGMISGTLMQIPIKGIYHTDFLKYAESITDDKGVSLIVEELIKWFYMRCRTIYTPTDFYRGILKERGYEESKIKTLRRGIDHTLFNDKRREERVSLTLPEGYLMLYTGRVSDEKNITFLLDLATRAISRSDEIHLIICGDGPALAKMKRVYSNKQIHFMGRLRREDMAPLYAKADLFLFPSTTDTFGMSVLEAQASGCPAVVTDVGGPQQIVINRVTGEVLPLDIDIWEKAIFKSYSNWRYSRENYERSRVEIGRATRERYSWENTIEDLSLSKEILPQESPRMVTTALKKAPIYNGTPVTLVPTY